MAPNSVPSQNGSAATLPRLLAISKDFTGLDEQIDQAAHIIGLPTDWETLQEEKERSDATQHLVRSRAEWVLRFILEKLKATADTGAHARAHPRAWNLLDWMIRVLPPSRSAAQLRDADFLSILERTLHDVFEKETVAVTAQDADCGDANDEPASLAASRKRKRPSPGPGASVKRVALSTDRVGPLFGGLVRVLTSITQRASLNASSGDAVQKEHMKMALRTETAQAARILRGWLSAVKKVLSQGSDLDSDVPETYLDLSLVLDIWELRTIDSADTAGASAEQFSAECLVPLLLLYNELRGVENQQSVTRKAIETLERLVARHLFAPARTSFFAHASSQSDSTDGPTPANVEELTISLEPLRAKVLLAAQIQDDTASIPELFKPLFSSVPRLLDMAIRMSPSRTPKNRAAERPWLQVVFVVLAECVGCSLEAPQFSVPEASLEALEEALNVLALHDVKVDTSILADIFWFHSGVKYPVGQKKIRWSLISALIKLDPDTFITGPQSDSTTAGERPNDLASFLFEQISSTTNFVDPDSMEIDIPGASQQPDVTGSQEEAIITSVIMPLMSAFARNRDLLGFLAKWDAQLCDSAPLARLPLKDVGTSVWADPRLCSELADHLEQSLTQPQITTLFNLHADRVKPEKGTAHELSMRQAYSSSVLLRALLWSVRSDEAVQALEPQLRSLLASFTDLVCDAWYRKHTDLISCWVTLCRLLVVLWPLGIHASQESQQALLKPILEQAHKDIGAGNKTGDERPVDSKTRAAALLFVLTLCDHVRSVPGWHDAISESVRKALKSLSRGRLDDAEYEAIVDIFCIDFPQLLEFTEADARRYSLSRLLEKVADLHNDMSDRLANGLSRFVFSSASLDLRDAYAAAYLDALDIPSKDGSVRATGLLAVRPSALSRERREALLNKLTEILLSQPEHVEITLSIMNILQQAPNATAQLSSNGGIFFDIAQALDECPKLSATTVQTFQDLVQQTLGHMLPNKDQAQNQKYLDKFRKRLKAISKRPQECTPPRFAILRAAMAVQKSDDFISWDRYVALLAACLPTSLNTESGTSILATFGELPTTDEFRELVVVAQTALRKHLGSLLTAGGYLEDSSLSAGTRMSLHAIVAKYQLFDDIRDFIELSRKLLCQCSRKHQAAVLESVAVAVSALSPDDQLGLIPVLLQAPDDGNCEASYKLLYVLVSKLDDKAHDDPENRTQQLSLLPRVCELLSESSSSPAFSSLLDIVDTIIRDKPSYASQHSLECVLASLVKISSRNSPALSSSDAAAIYTRLCETTRFVILLHRSRLGGRFHLLLPLFQNLLFCLYIPHAGKYNTLPLWLRPTSSSAPIKLTAANASQFSRILSTLCSPTLSSVSKSHLHRTISKKDSKSTLNDPVKAAREYVSHNVYPLLASFCRFQLNGRLDGAVREKLLPGLWEVVGTAALDKDNLQAMFAGLDKSSREIWRGVWEEWKAVEGRTKERFDKEKE